ncbi:hypothetical protein CDL15_Pgr014361 [Punica granatum]|uniref:F-box associated domain-containing protein n=1 Tax=Punica granatum TaxID=22663 RepID=A0A218WDZ5_PUNGR|nr:hypothetical protein CDL15_Pgr014361 [Punica granatum]
MDKTSSLIRYKENWQAKASVSVKGKVHRLVAKREWKYSDCSLMPIGLDKFMRFFGSNRMFYIYYWNEMSDNKFFEVWALEDFNKPVWFKHQVLEDANKFFFLASWWTNKIKLFAYDTTSKNWRSAPSVISPFYGFYSAGHVNSLISWSWTSSALLI